MHGGAAGTMTGVQGSAPAGIGVRARSDTGTALRVDGKAQFSNSGKATIPVGATSKLVTGAILDSSAAILVTLQGNPGPGVSVHYVQKMSATSFKVVLNKPAARSVAFGWFVVN